MPTNLQSIKSEHGLPTFQEIFHHLSSRIIPSRPSPRIRTHLSLKPINTPRDPQELLVSIQYEIQVSLQERRFAKGEVAV